MAQFQRCLVEALELAVRAELRKCADPAAALLQVQDMLAAVLVNELDESQDLVTQLNVRASLAAAVADVMPRLLAECERR